MKRLILSVLVCVLGMSSLVYACQPKDQPEEPVETPVAFVCPEGTVPIVDVPQSFEDCKEVRVDVQPVVTAPVVQAVAPVAESAPQPVFESFAGK